MLYLLYLLNLQILEQILPPVRLEARDATPKPYKKGIKRAKKLKLVKPAVI